MRKTKILKNGSWDKRRHFKCLLRIMRENTQMTKKDSTSVNGINKRMKKKQTNEK